MKIVDKKTLVKCSSEDIKDFGFIFNAKMVQILSDSLYEDKVLAIVRELSTNAYDSHCENGNPDQPFDVHLPTHRDPEFYIRDYGCGMSPEKIDTVYRHYGGSDRTDSNNFIGGFGLGSKTPFCYHTKTFTVDSWYDGTHYCYSAFVGQDGMPQIAKTFEGPSDDPTGVKITLPVRSGDLWVFEDRAEEVYSSFTVTPVFTGRELKIKPPEYSIKNQYWGYNKHRSRTAKVIIGQVAYKLSSSSLDLNPAQERVLDKPFDFFAQIGELSVNVSREGLSYDDRTKARIKFYINNVIQEANSQVQAEINKCKTLWEARQRVANMEHSMLNLVDNKKLEYNGEKLLSKEISLRHIDLSELKLDQIDIREYSPGFNQTPYEQKRTTFPIIFNGDVFINDLKTGCYVRSKYHCQNTRVKTLIINFKDEKQRQEFYKLSGLSDQHFTPISTIEADTVRNTRAKFTHVKCFNQNFRGHSDSFEYRFWNSCKTQDVEKGLYVLTLRSKFINLDNKAYHPYELRCLLDCLRVFDIKIPEIYGIRKADEKLAKELGLESCMTWFLDNAKALIKKHNYKQSKHDKQAYERVDNSFFKGFGNARKLSNVAKLCDSNSDLVKFMSIIEDLELISGSKLCNLDRLSRLCKTKMDGTVVDRKIGEKIGKILDKYPLLKYLDSSVNDAEVANYVTVIDNSTVLV
jgi:hypothetical protein